MPACLAFADFYHDRSAEEGRNDKKYRAWEKVNLK